VVVTRCYQQFRLYSVEVAGIQLQYLKRRLARSIRVDVQIDVTNKISEY
jgi:hypothetical protein